MNRGHRSLRLALLIALGVCPSLAGAQTGAGPEGRLVLGPLTLSPRFELGNVGIDTNVLNSSAQPVKDFTFMLVPGIDSTLRVGRTKFSSKSALEFTYFQKTASQRSRGYQQEERFDVPLAAATFFIQAQQGVTYRRPNLEIDQRVEQERRAVSFGTEVRLGSRSRITGTVSRGRTRYDNAVVEIAEDLDRETTQTTMVVSADLTPLTTLVVQADHQQDRFIRSSLRNADGTGVLAGFQFKPFALFSGSALVGVRRLDLADPRVPDFSGIVSTVQLGYLVKERTRFDLTVDRSVDYSIEDDQPYFVLFGGGLTVTQVVAGRWDAVGRYQRSVLTHRAIHSEAKSATPGRIDRQVAYGTGVGFRLNSQARIGFDVQYSRRLSGLDTRQYEGYRYGGSFNYAY